MSYRPKHPWRFILIASDGQHDRKMMQYAPAMPPEEKSWRYRSGLSRDEQCPIHINYVGCADQHAIAPAEDCQD